MSDKAHPLEVPGTDLDIHMALTQQGGVVITIQRKSEMVTRFTLSRQGALECAKAILGLLDVL